MCAMSSGCGEQQTMKTNATPEPAEIPALAEDLAYVRTVFLGLVEAWVRCGNPMPRTAARARAILDKTLTSAMSLQRQEIEPDVEESNTANIGSDELAEQLGVTRRTVQRRAESLGGQQISGAWVFDKERIGKS
jgi:HTH domain